MKQYLGTFFGAISTALLSDTHLFLGICSLILTIVCLVPDAFRKWGEFFRAYNECKKQCFFSGKNCSIFCFITNNKNKVNDEKNSILKIRNDLKKTQETSREA